MDLPTLIETCAAARRDILAVQPTEADRERWDRRYAALLDVERCGRTTDTGDRDVKLTPTYRLHHARAGKWRDRCQFARRSFRLIPIRRTIRY